MPEIYYLNGETLPTIPVPHDCVIDEISIENDHIVFKFEKDISYHDSIKHFKPDVESLVVKFHLENKCFDLYEWHNPIKIFADNGFYKSVDSSKLFQLADKKGVLEYLSHYVGYQSIIIELCGVTMIRLELTVDYVEFHWI